MNHRHRDFGHVGIATLERLLYTRCVRGVPQDAVSTPTQLAREYIDRKRWKLIEISEPGQYTATVTVPMPRIESYEVKGRDRERVLLIATLLADGVDVEEIL